MWYNGFIPGCPAWHGTFRRANDPLRDRHGGNQDLLDLWNLSKVPFSGYLVPILSGVLDTYDRYADHLFSDGEKENPEPVICRMTMTSCCENDEQKRTEKCYNILYS